ncbi:hypothetical protein HN903_04730 [archaeon]|jgi:hypothetical protein|nr:hypothetical protein [archaeon]MBT7129034.1 hypothetical protein [archaeon]
MDFGGIDRRRTKGDLKKKRLVRGYKRGGKFRSSEVNEESESKVDKMGKVVVKKKKGYGKGKKRKF